MHGFIVTSYKVPINFKGKNGKFFTGILLNTIFKLTSQVMWQTDIVCFLMQFTENKMVLFLWNSYQKYINKYSHGKTSDVKEIQGYPVK